MERPPGFIVIYEQCKDSIVTEGSDEQPRVKPGNVDADLI